MSSIRLCSFSGACADLTGKHRTEEGVLDCLRSSPRVSTWDMSEHAWLRTILADLERSGKIVEDKSEPYPWHRFRVVCP